VTEFKETETRKMCRNPKCRSKLPSPVSNEREAFCVKGCYSSFYLHRCRVCETELPKTVGKGRPRLICKKAKCKNAWAAGEGFGKFADSADRYPVSKNPEKAQETAAAQHVLSESKPVDRLNRLWRQIAGPLLTPNQLHCATVPDGPGCKWDGSYERIEAQNRRALEKHFATKQVDDAVLDFCAACGRDGNLVDHKVTADRWITLCCDCRESRLHPAKPKAYAFADDLTIPSFLDRRLSALQMAA
jgi:hypothetical protein